MGRDTALDMEWDVGSQVYLRPFRLDSSERIALEVVGIAEPVDPDAEYWMDVSSTYFTLPAVGFGQPIIVPIYVREVDFFNGLGTRYPLLTANYGWFLYLDTNAITASNVNSTRDAITGLETDINKRFPRSLVFTGLDTTLAEFQRDLTHARVPLFLFISLVVLVILYFLALVMGLLARTRTDEASLLRSRGASMPQMSGLLIIGEGVVVLLSIALGPLLAFAIVRYLLLDTINPAGDGGPIPLGISADMFVMGAIGGLLSLGVLMASSVGLARLGLVEFLRERARPPSVPLLQRYYVDLLVLAVLGLLWWQIQGREGFVERDVLSGALEGDISLRLAPVLVLLGAALVVLRLLPLLIRGLAWVGSLVAPAWIGFALTRMARDPVPHGSLVIILMMAAALGIFGATFQSTLSRSQKDQALYDRGGDLVVENLFASVIMQEQLASLSEVQTVSPIIRESGALVDAFRGTLAAIIAIDPDTLHKTAWFREDFADKSLTELLMHLRQTQTGPGGDGENGPQGITLPVDAKRVGIWMNLDEFSQDPTMRRPTLWMRVSNAAGRHRSFTLEDSPPPDSEPGDGSSQPTSTTSRRGGWTYLEARLTGRPGFF